MIPNKRKVPVKESLRNDISNVRQRLLYIEHSERKAINARGVWQIISCHSTNCFKLGKRSFPNKRILETIHETPACVKGITIEYYIF